MLDEIEQCACSLESSTTTSSGPFSVFRGRADVLEDGAEPVTLAQTIPQGSVCERSVEGVEQLTARVLLQPPSQSVSFFQSSKSQVNQLFSHYLFRVADVSQVICHAQNVSRSVHAQYAAQVWTQPLFASERHANSSSHKAIFCAIISTAAFHMRGPRSPRHEKWNFFDRIGRVHRLEALQHMQQAIKEPVGDSESYCARMSAMLTLVDSDVCLSSPHKHAFSLTSEGHGG